MSGRQHRPWLDPTACPCCRTLCSNDTISDSLLPLSVVGCEGAGDADTCASDGIPSASSSICPSTSLPSTSGSVKRSKIDPLLNNLSCALVSCSHSPYMRQCGHSDSSVYKMIKFASCRTPSALTNLLLSPFGLLIVPSHHPISLLCPIVHMTLLAYSCH